MALVKTASSRVRNESRMQGLEDEQETQQTHQAPRGAHRGTARHELGGGHSPR